MVRRPALAALGASLLLAGGAAACGSSGGPTGPAAAAPVRMGAVKVDPAAGPIGTMFTLTSDGLKEGETVAFEITFPGEGKAYPGAALSVPADGTAATTYRATTANQPGEYIVRLTGPPGSLAEGRFTVTNGPPVTSTLPPDSSASSISSTSLRTGTTRRSSRSTTTVLGATTTTRGSSTTATTKRVTTSFSTVTTKRV
ncbi:MAG: hypothetical protein ABIS47_14940 [Acidimicrobiales bacterium]